MSKRGKAGVVAGGKKRLFSRKTDIVYITSGTFHASCTQKGVVCIFTTTGGIEDGSVYISIDTAGTGTIFSD